jgi:hypothetical protein
MNILFVFIIVIIITGILAAYTYNMQAVTSFIGREIAEKEIVEQLAPRGFQDAITPRYQDIRNWLLMTMLLGIIIIGYLIKWYFVPIGLFLFSFLQFIFKQLLPKNINYYLIKLIANMDNRYADYVKSGDLVRADAAKTMSDLMKIYFEEIRRNNVLVKEIM